MLLSVSPHLASSFPPIFLPRCPHYCSILCLFIFLRYDVRMILSFPPSSTCRVHSPASSPCNRRGWSPAQHCSWNPGGRRWRFKRWSSCDACKEVSGMPVSYYRPHLHSLRRSIMAQATSCLLTGDKPPLQQFLSPCSFWLLPGTSHHCGDFIRYVTLFILAVD
jgi:hypothetical protein